MAATAGASVLGLIFLQPFALIFMFFSAMVPLGMSAPTMMDAEKAAVSEYSAPAGGSYTVYVTADDGTQLYVYLSYENDKDYNIINERNEQIRDKVSAYIQGKTRSDLVTTFDENGFPAKTYDDLLSEINSIFNEAPVTGIEIY